MKLKTDTIIRNKHSAARYVNWRSAKKRVNKKSNFTFFKLLKTSWKHQGKLFFVESTLHGVRYIAEGSRPIIERLIWFICVMVGAIATMVIIVSLWEKFQTNPTITGLDTDFHNWDIQFPAVTICPNEPWNENRLNAYITKLTEDHKLDKPTSERLTMYVKNLTQLAFGKLRSSDFDIEFDHIFKDQDLHQLSYDLVDTCPELLKHCTLKAEEQNCCELFYPVFTENGYCFTFNTKHHELKSPSGDVFPENEIHSIKETDIQWALEFAIEPRVEINSFNGTYNISIYLHKVTELVGYDLKPQHVWNFKMSALSFSMRETYTTNDAHQLSIKQRHCIYDDEIKLAIDEIYTFSGCAHQCRMNNAQRLCSCIPHFYKLTDNYRYCNVSQLKCIGDRKEEISNIEKCDCQLGCATTIYEIDKLVMIPVEARDDTPESDADSDGGSDLYNNEDFGDPFRSGDEDSSNSTDVTEEEQTATTEVTDPTTEVTDPTTEATELTTEATESSTEAPRIELMKFQCEFTTWPMIKYKREVLFGWVDLLVSFGGIAGLFLGFSLLSGVEIIYFFTIRACCMVYKQRDELEQIAMDDAKRKMANEDKSHKKKVLSDLRLDSGPYFIKERKPGRGEDMLRQRIKEKQNAMFNPNEPPKYVESLAPVEVVAQPMIVRPFNPNNKIVMPPFGYDFTN